MRHFEFSPLYRSTSGLDRVNRLMNSQYPSEKQDNYPPYNIERLDENNYLISIAVAGFSESEIDIEVEKNSLRVNGKKAEQETKSELLYRGIANRNFRKQFQLEELVKVISAEMDAGMLRIKLQREQPEHLKPRKITIHSGAVDKLHAA